MEVLWLNWLKYWGLQWEIRTTCKRKILIHFSHGHTERSLSYILLLYQSCSKLLYGQWLISIAERVDHLDIKKNLHLTISGYISSWLAVFLRGMWKLFFCAFINRDWISKFSTPFHDFWFPSFWLFFSFIFSLTLKTFWRLQP